MQVFDGSIPGHIANESGLPAANDGMTLGAQAQGDKAQPRMGEGDATHGVKIDALSDIQQHDPDGMLADKIRQSLNPVGMQHKGNTRLLAQAGCYAISEQADRADDHDLHEASSLLGSVLSLPD